jgi:AmmeMemoRadiSam system protein A
MQQPCGAFVTLYVDGELNGCIGNIDSRDPLGACIATLAVQAAFEDPRLPKLHREDLDGLHIEVSLLSPRGEVPANSRSQLLEQLTPGVHGLIIASEHHRAVFLPSVWAQLPVPDHFLDQLLRKAGLSTRGWPNDMHAEVFTTESFGRQLG